MRVPFIVKPPLGAALAAPHWTRVPLCAMLDDDEKLDPNRRVVPTEPVPLLIDIVLRTFSWAFLPIIVICGLAISTALGRTSFPIRVGAPRDPLAFPAPSKQHSRAPLDHPLLLASADLFGDEHPLLLASADPFVDELRDPSSVTRSLSLPKSEQRREAALQELEDERLERCRSVDKFSFDQCFFFGSMDTTDMSSRRAMEGGGTIERRGGGAATLQPQLGGAAKPASSGIPTW